MGRIALVLLGTIFLFSSTSKAQNQKIRKISDSGSSTQSQVNQISLRIENGQIWVNGNLLGKKYIPSSLQELNNDLFYQARVFGMTELTFNLQGRHFLVKTDRIIEVSPPSPKSSSTAKNQEAMEDYYSQLKEESPGLFYSLGREATLTEQCRRLIVDYQYAKGKEKGKIESQIREILSQLFDINERNRELEIKELQQLIDAANKEIRFRQENKRRILDNKLEDILGN